MHNQNSLKAMDTFESISFFIDLHLLRAENVFVIGFD